MYWLSKIAQQAATPSTGNGASTTQSPVITTPPTFQASGVFGWLNAAYNSQTTAMINTLITTLNIALHYASNGQFNFQILRNNGFQVDPSSASNVDAKNLLNLSMLVYKTFLNFGNQPLQKFTPVQISNWVKLVSSSQPLLNLSQLNPTSVIAQKLPGNLKDNIMNYLRYIALYNPVQ